MARIDLPASWTRVVEEGGRSILAWWWDDEGKGRQKTDESWEGRSEDKRVT
jgi:hypothetical protein